MIDFNIDNDGVATLVWNVANRPMNVLNDESISRFAELVNKVASDKAIKGAIITSSRPEFVVGADLEQLRHVKDAKSAFEMAGGLSKLLRDMEKSGKPFVAAINGSALGGGFEICLACHRRIAADNPKTQVGLPEVTLGLLPGAGGTQRMPRLTGLAKALPLLLEGRPLNVAKAKETGLVDEIVPADALLARAKEWILQAKPEDAVQPWDKKGYKIPGGGPQTPAGRNLFMAASAGLLAKTAGLYPAPAQILSCLHDGCNVGIDAGLRVEGRAFATLAISPEARNLINTMFYAMGEANRLAGRPKAERRTFKRVGVLGAGMMGHGIALVSAKAGLDVVLLDVTRDAAEAGRAKALAPFAKQVAQGRMSQADVDALGARIKPTADYADLAQCDIVIEAVFENRDIKAEATRKTEAVIAANAIFATNTSTLPITGLAEASVRRANFIGLHFFSPVERMQLVEVIVGAETSPETVAHAMDFVKQIRKTPIVVKKDSRAFYTSRVFGTYVYEGMALLADGVLPSVIERAGTNSGMPMSPLALMDEVSLELMHKVMRQTQADLGADYKGQPQDPVLIKMVEELKRIGRKSGAGFYDYAADGTKSLWPELGRHFPVAAEQPDFAEVRKRLMFIQSLEAARCIEEGVIDAASADVGSILGWGFPPALGGAISQIDTVGVARFVEECDRLAQRYGARFLPPKSLREHAAQNKAFRAA